MSHQNENAPRWQAVLNVPDICWSPGVRYWLLLYLPMIRYLILDPRPWYQEPAPLQMEQPLQCIQFDNELPGTFADKACGRPGNEARPTTPTIPLLIPTNRGRIRLRDKLPAENDVEQTKPEFVPAGISIKTKASTPWRETRRRLVTMADPVDRQELWSDTHFYYKF